MASQTTGKKFASVKKNETQALQDQSWQLLLPKNTASVSDLSSKAGENQYSGANGVVMPTLYKD